MGPDRGPVLSARGLDMTMSGSPALKAILSAAAGLAALAMAASAHAYVKDLTATTVLQTYDVTHSDTGLDISYVITSGHYDLDILGYIGSTLSSETIVGPLGSSGTYDTYPPTEYFPGTKIDYYLSPVPEAASWALMLVGMGAVGFTLRRRAAKTASVAV